MTIGANIGAAEARPSQLVAAATRGEEVVVAKAARRRFGSFRLDQSARTSVGTSLHLDIVFVTANAAMQS